MKRTHIVRTPSEQAEILQMIEASSAGVLQALQDVGVARSTYYGWKQSTKNNHARTSGSKATPRRLYALERAVRRETAIREVLAVSPCPAGATRAQKLATMAELNECGKFSVHALCAAHGIDCGTFYNYLKRGKVKTGEAWFQRRREEMKQAVERVFHESDQRFGADKIVAVLRKDGIATTRKYVKWWTRRDSNPQPFGADPKSAAYASSATRPWGRD